MTKKLTAEQKKKSQYIAVIKEKHFDDLKIVNSANAWWLDTSKVQRLIDAYKIDASNDEAWSSAGITRHQYEYFLKVHPQFSVIKDILKKLPTFTARRTVVNALKDSPTVAFEYLRRKRKREFSDRSELTGADGEALAINFDVSFKPKQDDTSPKTTGNSK